MGITVVSYTLKDVRDDMVSIFLSFAWNIVAFRSFFSFDAKKNKQVKSRKRNGCNQGESCSEWVDGKVNCICYEKKKLLERLHLHLGFVSEIGIYIVRTYESQVKEKHERLFTFCNGPGQIDVIQCQVAGRWEKNTKQMRDIIGQCSLSLSLHLCQRCKKKESLFVVVWYRLVEYVQLFMDY